MTQNHPTLEGTVGLVAGASGDIGRAIAFQLLEAGSEVFMLGRDLARLRRFPPPEQTQGRHHFLAADLTEEGAAARLDAAIRPAGRLDVLVLSSGTYARSSEPSVFAQQVSANLLGPYALIRQLLPLIIRSKGQIAFINSSQALKAGKEVGQYAATKHAMKAIADSLRDEVNADGVRVMSIFLGRTASERQRAIFVAEQRPYRPELLVQPCDIAQLLVFSLQLPRTCEITDLVLRPMAKS